MVQVEGNKHLGQGSFRKDERTGVNRRNTEEGINRIERLTRWEVRERGKQGLKGHSGV